MNNKLLFFICILFFPISFYGQSLRIVSGLQWSSFDSSTEFKILDKKVNTFSIGVEMDLYTTDKFVISSGLSYIQLGGRETNPLIESWKDYSKKWSYLSFNSTFRYKVIADNSGYAFLGVGPQINVNIDSGNFNNTLYEESGFKMNTLSLGAVLEGGYLRNITNEEQLGILVQYIRSLTPYSTNEFVNFSFHPYSINLVLGYKL